MSIEATSVYAGAKVRRKTFVMRVGRCGLASSQIMESALVEVVKHLAGFKTVTLGVLPTEIFVRRPEENYRCLARCQSEKRI